MDFLRLSGSSWNSHHPSIFSSAECRIDNDDAFHSRINKNKNTKKDSNWKRCQKQTRNRFHLNKKMRNVKGTRRRRFSCPHFLLSSSFLQRAMLYFFVSPGKPFFLPIHIKYLCKVAWKVLSLFSASLFLFLFSHFVQTRHGGPSDGLNRRIHGWNVNEWKWKSESGSRKQNEITEFRWIGRKDKVINWQSITNRRESRRMKNEETKAAERASIFGRGRRINIFWNIK